MAYDIPRMLHDRVIEALADTPVVAVLGARASGKSTLTRAIAGSTHPAHLVDLDDRSLAQAAQADPIGFLAERPRPLLIDEIQHAPDLLYAIKQAIFDDPTPGGYLLTGSANILTAPRIKEALTGRAEYLYLWPLAQRELTGAPRNFVDRAFDADLPLLTGAPIGRSAFVDAIARGGFPSVRTRDSRGRGRWYEAYMDSLVLRDLAGIVDARKLEQIPRVLRLLAAQSANIFSANAAARRLGLDDETISSYASLLETVFVTRRLRAWRPGIGSRELQRPKIYIVDSGMLLHLLGADERRLADDDQVTGKALESFVAMELARLVDVADARVAAYHYRDRNDEIDVVLEKASGEIVAVEVKASASISPADYRPLVKLRERKPEQFVAGVVLYTGGSTQALGDRLWAAPISALWS